VDKVINAILGLSGTPAYVLIFALAALESSSFLGFLFPGELAVLLGGVLASQGRITLGGAIAVAVSGAIIGDTVGYAIGARWGGRLLRSRFARFVDAGKRKRAEDLIQRRGGTAVFLGRFSAFLRVLVPGLAGASGMRYRKFLVFNVLGGATWATLFTVLGFFAGDAWSTVRHIAARASSILAAVLLLGLVAVIVGRWLSRNEEKVNAWWARQKERPWVAAFLRKYERQITFLLERLNPAEALGLYVTIGLAVSFAFAWAFAAAVQDVVTGEELVKFDAPIARFVMHHQSDLGTQVMSGLTVLGSAPIVIAVGLVIAVAAARRLGSLRPAAFLLGCITGGYGLEIGFRLLIQRVAPGKALETSLGFAFPSGHTMAAVVLWGGLALVVARLSLSWALRVWALVGAAVVVLLVAVSRVYLGVFYTSDVVAGGALGAMWLAFCFTAWHAWDRLDRSEELRSTRNKVARRVLRWVALAVSIGVFFYIVLLAIPGIRNSASALRNLNPFWVVVALGLEVAANLCLPQVYREAIIRLGGRLDFRRALKTSMAMFTIAHVLPAGGAAGSVVGAREFTASGVDTATATTAVVIAPALAMGVLGGIVFFGSGASLFRGDLPPAYIAGIIVVLAIVAALELAGARAVGSRPFRSALFKLVESVTAKLRIRINLSSLRASVDAMAEKMPNFRELRPLFAWSAANWLFDAAALWVLFLGFGYRMHIGVLLVGYGIANLASALPVTPGGLGFVEAGLAGAYAAFGAPGGVVVVTVLAYRLLSYWLPIAAGAPFYLQAARRARRRGSEKAILQRGQSGKRLKARR
jgi:undecaprenyl-diphosphatase